MGRIQMRKTNFLNHHFRFATRGRSIQTAISGLMHRNMNGDTLTFLHRALLMSERKKSLRGCPRKGW